MSTATLTKPTFAERRTQLEVVRVLAVRYPDAADALSAIIATEEAAVRLDDLTTEEIARRAAEGHDVTWGWQDSFESGDENSVWLDLGELRLEIAELDGGDRYDLGHYNFSRWYAEETANGPSELFDRVQRWVRRATEMIRDLED